MRNIERLLWRTFIVCGLSIVASWAQAQSLDDWLRMRNAYAQRDVVALQSLAARVPPDHVLKPLVAYWMLSARLPDASPDEVDAFLARWANTYYEDRLRNEWMRLLGDRSEWSSLLVHDARFRMQDDDDVACWVALAQWHVQQRWDMARVKQAWDDQRSKGQGCQAAAQALLTQGHWQPLQIFEAVRKAVEYGRRSEAKALAALVDDRLAHAADLAIRQPDRLLVQLSGGAKAPDYGRWRSEVATWAWVRRVKREPQQWPRWQLELRQAGLSTPQQHWVTSALGTWMALAQLPEAAQVFDARRAPNDETHAEWRLRAALRLSDWQGLSEGLRQSPKALRETPTWRYWQAVAWQHVGDKASRAEAQRVGQSLADAGGYYGALAQAVLGAQARVVEVPEVDAQTLAQVKQHPALLRAQAAMAVGLHSEGAREWHYVIALQDGHNWAPEALRAAAQWACDQGMWDRCINTSLRIDGADAISRRYPTPWRDDVRAAAQAAGVDVAAVYGLMRQESRFVDVARSAVGASGLMQLMPGTARWTAKKIGMSRVELARWRERDVNLKLGMHYFKHVLDEAGGALPVAAAAYNAGPGRVRRWLPEMPMDTAIWLETVPITETRQYAQVVTHNAWIYAAALAQVQPTFVQLLTPTVSAAQWREVDDAEDGT